MDINSRIARIIFIMLVFIITPSKTAIGHREPVNEEHVNKPTKKHGNKLLVILVDGMRHDALEKGLKGLDMMKTNGVYSKNGLVPSFPSVSFTNYYSITTGLYAESHGMIGNNIYNLKENKSFLLSCYANHTDANQTDVNVEIEPQWWNEAEPIWVTAIAQGKRVKMVRWPGCEVKMLGYTPTSANCFNYTRGIEAEDLQTDIQSTLEKFATDKLDFAGIYQEEPDHTQHKSGVWSVNATDVVKKLADAIEQLQNTAGKLLMSYDNKTKLEEVLDVIILSDHGHMNLTRGIVDVPSLGIQKDAIHVLINDQVLQVWPKDGKKKLIYNTLKKNENMTVYMHEEIPEAWHYKNNERVPPVIAVIKPGFSFFDDKAIEMVSSHGYNNTLPDMAGVFLARGPHFKKGVSVESLDNVNVYQVMCSILGIPPKPNNGTWSTVKDLLVEVSSPSEKVVSFRSVVITVIVAVVAVILLTILVCGCHYFKQQNRTKQYRTLPTNIENELDADELDL